MTLIGHCLRGSLWRVTHTAHFQNSITCDPKFLPWSATSYPDLTDGPGTNSCPPIQGLQNTVIFIDHNHPDNGNSSLFDPKYVHVTTSKSNRFKIDMTVEIVKYLKQQISSSSEITVLTLYLGQLVKLWDVRATHAL